MELIAKERDRLLQRTARFLGLAGVIVTLISLSVPGALPFGSYIATIPLLAVLAFSHIMVARSLAVIWASLGILAGVGALLVARLPFDEAPSRGLASALTPLAAAGMACFALILVSSVPRILLFVIGAAASAILVQYASADADALSSATLSVILGWVLTAVLGYWLSASVPRAARRIYSIGKAHRAERQASETEAQRRQGARLLHDTVLATLTLLAHSGVGVAPEALREQSAEDARLLRQLRLGATPTPQSSGPYNLTPVEETPLGTTLE